MRVLLSTIGSRGDVQPLVALALQLKALGQEVRLCVPPDFRDWIEGLGCPSRPSVPKCARPGKPARRRRRPRPSSGVRWWKARSPRNSRRSRRPPRGCDIIVGATALQIAARSVAEKMGIPYVFAAYCPAVLPSPHHAPPVLAMLGDKPAHRRTTANSGSRMRNAGTTSGDLLNSHRA